MTEPRTFVTNDDRHAGVMPEAARELLRHCVATLAYRAEKVLRDVPDDFVERRPSPGSRTPLELLSHLGDLMAWAESLARGEYRWRSDPATTWVAATERFYRGLAALDAALAEITDHTYPSTIIFQGPIADALTHVGQIAMMRGMVGLPVQPESYARADIQVGRVGSLQSAVRVEFDGDVSAPRPRA